MADPHRPDYGDPCPPGSRALGTKAPMYHFQGNNQSHRQDRSRAPREFAFRTPRHKIAERPLLSLRRESSPDLVAPDFASEPTTLFRDADNMTDSDAEDMDMSDADTDGVAPKRLKVSDEQSAPRWSNPDPYTSLPPIEDTARKRTDIVKLIRKSRVATFASGSKDVVPSSEDFISFGLDDFQPPTNAPSGPRRGIGDTSKRKRDTDGENTQAAATLISCGLDVAGDTSRGSNKEKLIPDELHQRSVTGQMTIDPDPSTVRDRYISQSAEIDNTAKDGRLYIGNLPYKATGQQVREFFKGHEVVSVDISTNPRTNRPVGYCFVDLASANDADRAILNLNGKMLLGRKISIQLAKPTSLNSSAQMSSSNGSSGPPGIALRSIVNISSDVKEDDDFESDGDRHESADHEAVPALRKPQTSKDRARQRAETFRRLRPDLKNIPKVLKELRAIQIGGYVGFVHMKKDLEARKMMLRRDGKIDPSFKLAPIPDPPTKAETKAESIKAINSKAHRLAAAEKRAQQFRRLRPGVKKVPNRFRKMAAELGGYKTYKKMKHLNHREAALTTSKKK